jgi:hypothetical protein
MKYYVYISDAKIDMLLPQVPHDLKKKVATEFGFDLKILSAKRKSEIQDEDTRVGRLETVVEFIRQYGDLGTLDEPKPYIEDTLPMKSGTLGHTSSGDPQLIYFGAQTHKTVLGLFGSVKHMIGASGLTALPGGSVTNLILAYLKGTVRFEQSEVFDAVEHLTTSMDSPLEQLEFFAKRLLYKPESPGRSGDKRAVIMASPLYVAKAD